MEKKETDKESVTPQDPQQQDPNNIKEEKEKKQIKN